MLLLQLYFTLIFTKGISVSAEEPTIMTGALDWQSTSIEPAFIYANETPDFASLPEGTERSTFEKVQDKHKVPGLNEQGRKDALICYQAYDVCMKGLAPKLRPARLLDPTLFRLFHYCHTTWRDSAMAIRQELIELSAHWAELGLQGSCPVSLTEEELKEHARDYEDFETFKDLNYGLETPSIRTRMVGFRTMYGVLQKMPITQCTMNGSRRPKNLSLVATV